MNKNCNDKKSRYVAGHNGVLDKLLIKRIGLVKKWIVQEIPCYFHCTQNWKCKKLPKYKNILKQLSDILEYTIKKKPQEAIKEIWKLSSKAIIMRSKIKSCIYIQERLTRQGYNRWREYPAHQVKSFIKVALEQPIPCLDMPCVKINKCKRFSNYSNIIMELEDILKSYGKQKQTQRQIVNLTTEASESHWRLSKCANLQKSSKHKQTRLF